MANLTEQERKERRKQTRNKNIVWQGSLWISRVNRLAIYLRDNFTCIYCGKHLTDGILLALDHIVARSTGENDHSSGNLITCCNRCNSKRQNKPIDQFLALLYGENAHIVREKIAEQVSQDITPFCETAEKMIKVQKGYNQVLQSIKN